jgi:hypothetical protein
MISTVAGGGGALMVLPVTSALIGVGSTAPVVQLGAFIGRPARLILFWKHIHWPVAWYYLPAAIIASILGAWLFVQIRWEGLKIILALFLISTVFQYRFGQKARSFHMKRWYFIPVGFLVVLVSTIAGGAGPLLNPFYLNYGLEKEALIATKTANSFFVGIVQIGSYSFFGALHSDLWLYGLALGLGATLGNIIGKRLLTRMTNKQFRQVVILAMVISGVVMLVDVLLKGG